MKFSWKSKSLVLLFIFVGLDNFSWARPKEEKLNTEINNPPQSFDDFKGASGYGHPAPKTESRLQNIYTDFFGYTLWKCMETETFNKHWNTYLKQREEMQLQRNFEHFFKNNLDDEQKQLILNSIKQFAGLPDGQGFEAGWRTYTIQELRNETQNKSALDGGPGKLELLKGNTIQELVRDGVVTQNSAVVSASTWSSFEGGMNHQAAQLNDMQGHAVQGETVAMMLMASSIYRKYVIHKNKEISLLEAVKGFARNEMPTSLDFHNFNNNFKVGYVKNGTVFFKACPNQKFHLCPRSDSNLRIDQITCFAIKLDSRIPLHNNQGARNSAMQVVIATTEGAIRSAFLNDRKKIFLTPVGAGAFRNPTEWFIYAVERMKKFILEKKLEIYIVLMENLTHWSEHRINFNDPIEKSEKSENDRRQKLYTDLSQRLANPNANIPVPKPEFVSFPKQTSNTSLIEQTLDEAIQSPGAQAVTPVPPGAAPGPVQPPTDPIGRLELTKNQIEQRLTTLEQNIKNRTAAIAALAATLGLPTQPPVAPPPPPAPPVVAPQPAPPPAPQVVAPAPPTSPPEALTQEEKLRREQLITMAEAAFKEAADGSILKFRDAGYLFLKAKEYYRCLKSFEDWLNISLKLANENKNYAIQMYRSCGSISRSLAKFDQANYYLNKADVQGKAFLPYVENLIQMQEEVSEFQSTKQKSFNENWSQADDDDKNKTLNQLVEVADKFISSAQSHIFNKNLVSCPENPTLNAMNIPPKAITEYLKADECIKILATKYKEIGNNVKYLESLNRRRKIYIIVADLFLLALVPAKYIEYEQKANEVLEEIKKQLQPGEQIPPLSSYPPIYLYAHDSIVPYDFTKESTEEPNNKYSQHPLNPRIPDQNLHDVVQWLKQLRPQHRLNKDALISVLVFDHLLSNKSLSGGLDNILKDVNLLTNLVTTTYGKHADILNQIEKKNIPKEKLPELLYNYAIIEIYNHFPEIADPSVPGSKSKETFEATFIAAKEKISELGENEYLKKRIADLAKFMQGKPATGLRAHFDKTMKTDNYIFSIFGPHTHVKYGSISIVLKNIIYDSTNSYLLPCAASQIYKEQGGKTINRNWVDEGNITSILSNSRLIPRIVEYLAWETAARDLMARVSYWPEQPIFKGEEKYINCPQDIITKITKGIIDVRLEHVKKYYQSIYDDGHSTIECHLANVIDQANMIHLSPIVEKIVIPESDFESIANMKNKAGQKIGNVQIEPLPQIVQDSIDYYLQERILVVAKSEHKFDVANSYADPSLGTNISGMILSPQEALAIWNQPPATA